MRSAALLLIATVVALSLPTPGHAAFTGTGKNSGYASVTQTAAFPSIQAPILAAAIAKGKSKRVLEITATLMIVSASASSPNLLVDVNGFPVEPTSGVFGFYSHECSGQCTLTATWWLDLDAAEMAHPGIYIGQQLAVVLRGSDGGAGGQTYVATLSAKMGKK